MPLSVTSISSSADRRRLSQSLNRVAALGHLAGMNAANIPPFRADSPMTVMAGELRTLYGTPSFESMNTCDAVVTQIADPRTPHAPPPGEPETGRRSRRDSLALSDSGRSTRSTGSKTSRSRARNHALSQQRGQAGGSVSGEKAFRPPLSHPGILMPPHMRAKSEAAIPSGSTAQKRLSMALRGNSRKFPGKPDSIRATYRGSRLVMTQNEILRPMPPMPKEPESGLDSCRFSTATITSETYTDRHKMATSRDIRRERSESITAKAVGCIEDGDLRSVCSAKFAAAFSHIPRDLGVTPDNMHHVKAHGIDFEMIDPASVRESEPERSFRPLSVAIPPSQQSRSSFTVNSMARSPTPLSAASPSTVSVSPTESFGSSLRREEGTRLSTRSSATSVSRSRSPSPARGSLNPSPGGKSMLARLERLSNDFHRGKYHFKQAAGLSDFKVISSDPVPQQDIVFSSRNAEPNVPTSPVKTACETTSFGQRIAAGGGPQRGVRRVSAYIPSAEPKAPTASQPVRSSVTLREQESNELFVRNLTQKRQSFLGDVSRPVRRNVPPPLHRTDSGLANLDFGFDDQVIIPPKRAETPPSFENRVQRSDSLFMENSSARSSQTRETFLEWPQWQQPTGQMAYMSGIATQSYEILDILPKTTYVVQSAPTARNDRQLLPSQQAQSSAPVSALQRRSITNYAAGANMPKAPQPAVQNGSSGSGRLLRKTMNIDFSKMRDAN
ncbi:hypothetical protein BKA67DRAFT_60939 [Truncatella angustata]|uniref:Uncharacterized protein n=1 Tax=Truncatella angustata TaxID=152316 RepID=A0A9P8UY21_9PEZI|nr:uncharacterized protein BKA67DRAFT_60939 [Truncatella angustata]KAH6660641.1 hypothetical protein BKA67DRAFT_60939 [Truncatella angustata]KAH8199130.1 hypothetical protein TruAng_006716 [Truncatella angustata]